MCIKGASHGLTRNSPDFCSNSTVYKTISPIASLSIFIVMHISYLLTIITAGLATSAVIREAVIEKFNNSTEIGAIQKRECYDSGSSWSPDSNTARDGVSTACIRVLTTGVSFTSLLCASAAF
jgi:hypothetical protein